MSDIHRIFLLQALDLFASYLFGRTVELEATPVGVGHGPPRDETSRFLLELESRHAIACALRLKEILGNIERDISSTSMIRRGESRGLIRGRLDIPQYIARRAAHRSFPKSYPVVINEESYDVPENMLARKLMQAVAVQLSRSPFPRSFAEGMLSRTLYGLIHAHLQRMPWAGMKKVAPIKLLQRASEQRIRKRQTGNELAYQRLLEWSLEWQVDVSKLGSDGREKIVNGLLAFPVGNFFWEKVFEVWCLREIVESLKRRGYSVTEGPKSLHERTTGPIYRLIRGTHNINVWFQRQSPMGVGVWRYTDSENYLRGIPDIVLSTEDLTPLIIDAKFRHASSASRSEETYKLLGYAENFRKTYEDSTFHGVLIFVGDGCAERVLIGPDNGRVSLIIVDQRIRTDHFKAYLDNSLLAWLNSRH